MYIFYQKYPTKICLLNLGFSKLSFFHELFPDHPDSFSLSLSPALSLSLSLSLSVSIYELYSIKPFYFTENMIYVKLDAEAANISNSYHLKSSIIYSQWNYLS